MMKTTIAVFAFNLFVSSLAVDIPSQPIILEIECRTVTALLKWSSTGGDPPNDYLIQYQTNWSPHEWIPYKFSTPLIQREINLFLSPYANYTFHVIARNDAGVSEPSDESKVCETDEDVPYKNPEMVYGQGNGSDNLVITWKPMSPIDQNAPGFYYKVYWKRKDIQSEGWSFRTIKDWQQNHVVINNLPKLKPFLIKVEAFNSKGKAKVDADEVIGVSGEDMPTEAPKNFRTTNIRDGKSATLTWDPVPPLSLKGHFKGYKIQTWTDNEENKREVTIDHSRTLALVNIFTPGAINKAHILAYNGAFDGPPSDPIEIITPDDVYPDPPKFKLKRIADHNGKAIIRVSPMPNDTNGNPGKEIFIQFRRKGIDTLDPWNDLVSEKVNEANHVDVTVELNMVYEFRVVAVFGALETPSVIKSIETPDIITTSTTVSSTVNFQDNITISPPLSTKESNISFERPPYQTPKTQGAPHIPEFDIRDNNNELGNNINDETETEQTSKSFSKTPWFIALLCVLAFICIFISVFIFIKRRRTGTSIPPPNNKSRSIVDTVRGLRIMRKQNSNDRGEPAESNRFMVNDSNGVGNGNVGHDEGDADEDDDYPPDNKVYKDTTRKLPNV